jgi:hypothetical protein
MTRELLYFEITHSLIEQLPFLEKNALTDPYIMLGLPYILAKHGKLDRLSKKHSILMDISDRLMESDLSHYQKLFEKVKYLVDQKDENYNSNWDRIEAELSQYSTGKGNLILYSDGFFDLNGPIKETTVSGKIYHIAPEHWRGIDYLQSLGSRHAKALADLLEDGAVFEGVEDKRELLSHSLYIDKIAPLLKKIPLLRNRVNGADDKFVEARDLAIARKINKDLPEDKVGILFLGGAHKAYAHLAKDISVNRYTWT